MTSIVANPEKKILCLSGGGMRGLHSLGVLSVFESIVGRSVFDYFDLIVGTSTGGISAIALAGSAGRGVSDVARLYRTRGSQIFPRSVFTRIRTLGGTVGPKYPASGVEAAFSAEFSNVLMSGAQKPVAVVAYDVQQRKTQLITSWNRWNGMSQAMAARCTSAAPTYFPPVILTSAGSTMVDGGLTAQNPSMIALDAAHELGWGINHVRVLSVGTGFNEGAIPAQPSWGAVEWLPSILDIYSDGVAERDTEDAQAVLGGRYLHIDSPLDPAFLDMDRTDAVAYDYWQRLGENIGRAMTAQIKDWSKV